MDPSPTLGSSDRQGLAGTGGSYWKRCLGPDPGLPDGMQPLWVMTSSLGLLIFPHFVFIFNCKFVELNHIFLVEDVALNSSDASDLPLEKRSAVAGARHAHTLSHSGHRGPCHWGAVCGLEWSC